MPARRRTPNSGSFAKGNKLSRGLKSNGRPKNEAKAAVKELLLQKYTGDNPEGKTFREKAIETLWCAMESRDRHGALTTAAVRAAETILSYTDGLPKQTMGFDPSEPLKIVVEYDE